MNRLHFDFALQKGEQAYDIAKAHDVAALHTLGGGTPTTLLRTLPKLYELRTITVGDG